MVIVHIKLSQEYKSFVIFKNIGKAEIVNRRDRVSEDITQLAAEVKVGKDRLTLLDSARWEAARRYRKSKDGYDELSNARQEKRIIRKELIPKEKKLRELRQTLYYWNKLYAIAPVENDGDVEVEATEEKDGEEADEEEGEADEEEEVKEAEEMMEGAGTHGEEEEAQGIGTL
ncbi:hypothetical protein BGZ49_008220 [Haplosporangium sp. Z 27]|nr:hypothetical protein BGZ49_008220 [Haplosporangium sp. Z 27]